MKKLQKSIFLFVFLILFTTILSGCNSEQSKSFNTKEDFENSKIGVLTGSSFDILAKEYFPKADKLFHMNITDLVLNLKQEKIDGILIDESLFTPFLWEGENLSSVHLDMPATEYAIAFPKSASSEKIKNQINEFIKTRTENGWLDNLKVKWFAKTEPKEVFDFSKLIAKNGTLRVATSVEGRPFSYLNDGNFAGFDAEFLFNFAKDYGYAIEIDAMDFGALLPSITVGRYDLAMSTITVTEERKESVLFSDTYCKSSIVMAIQKKDEETNKKLTLADIENSTIGIVTGTNYDIIAQKKFPNATRKYFTSTADVLLALKQEKVDVLFADRDVYASMKWEKADITCLDEPIEYLSNALILSKTGYDENLLNQINSFITQAKNDGTLKYLEEKWFGDTEPTVHPDYENLTGENGTLKIAIGDSMKPSAYKKGTFFTGYEVDFLTLFAKAYGYKLDFHGMVFEAIIPSVVSGKCDIGASAITITPERTESVTFSLPHLETYGVAVVRENSKTEENELTLNDFNNSTLGVLTGSLYDFFAKENFPDAKRKYYTLTSDMILAVEQGKIDAYLSEITYVTGAIWEGAKIKTVPGVIANSNAGFILQKSEKYTNLRNQLDAFIKKSRENGFLDRLYSKWISDKEPTEVFDAKSLTGENGTIKVVVSPDLKPLAYVKDGDIVGLEVEILQNFAKEYGYKLEIVTATFDAILPGVVAGKYDIGAGGITINEERAESVNFSESYLSVDIVMVVKQDSSASDVSFWDELKVNFEKTFIREDRWKLIAEGIGVTMLISICSAIFGSLLGFGLYMLSRSDTKIIRHTAKGIAKVYSRIIAGTPIVVILMILFYVIFANFRDMSGVVVAIIGFTLTFGAFVYDHLTVSVNSVNLGQTEAAYALGYPKTKTFFRIILPQAMDVFLPSYCGQAVELIKATAVVGYVAVNDLTKMGDIIRSNTYEAFFPLIATAIIYFILTWILSLLLKLVKVRFEPKRRSKEEILKGVKTV